MKTLMLLCLAVSAGYGQTDSIGYGYARPPTADEWRAMYGSAPKADTVDVTVALTALVVLWREYEAECFADSSEWSIWNCGYKPGTFTADTVWYHHTAEDSARVAASEYAVYLIPYRARQWFHPGPDLPGFMAFIKKRVRQ